MLAIIIKNTVSLLANARTRDSNGIARLPVFKALDSIELGYLQKASRHESIDVGYADLYISVLYVLSKRGGKPKLYYLILAYEHAVMIYESKLNSNHITAFSLL
jgi:hypothetical protein